MQCPKPYDVVARNIDPASDNKIHDDDVARTFGFAGALVPGVELFAYLTHPLVEAWGEEFLSSGQIDVRFRRPVYDGEPVRATAEPDDDGCFALLLTGADGGRRAARPDLGRFVDAELPADPPPATPGALPAGPLGTVREPVGVDALERYLDAIAETLPCYRQRRIVHPGALLRAVNAILIRNVRLGPWIHTGSSCRFLGIASAPTTLIARAAVTDTFERNGHDYVRYDALVCADDQPVLHVDHTAIYRLGAT